MATDGLVLLFWKPIFAIFVLLVFSRVFVKKEWINKRIFGVSWSSILSGLVGALIGVYIFSAATSYIEAIDRVAEYESLEDQGALSLAFGWSIYLFILLAAVVLIAFVLFFVPVLAILSRLRLVSVLGVTLIALVFIGTSAGFTYLSPHNNWCQANIVSCVRRSVFESVFFVLPVLLGFLLGARLPFFFSKRTEN